MPVENLVDHLSRLFYFEIGSLYGTRKMIKNISLYLK